MRRTRKMLALQTAYIPIEVGGALCCSCDSYCFLIGSHGSRTHRMGAERSTWAMSEGDTRRTRGTRGRHEADTRKTRGPHEVRTNVSRGSTVHTRGLHEVTNIVRIMYDSCSILERIRVNISQYSYNPRVNRAVFVAYSYSHTRVFESRIRHEYKEPYTTVTRGLYECYTTIFNGFFHTTHPRHTRKSTDCKLFRVSRGKIADSHDNRAVHVQHLTNTKNRLTTIDDLLKI